MCLTGWTFVTRDLIVHWILLFFINFWEINSIFFRYIREFLIRQSLITNSFELSNYWMNITNGKVSTKVFGSMSSSVIQRPFSWSAVTGSESISANRSTYTVGLSTSNIFALYLNGIHTGDLSPANICSTKNSRWRVDRREKEIVEQRLIRWTIVEAPSFRSLFGYKITGAFRHSISFNAKVIPRRKED